MPLSLEHELQKRRTLAIISHPDAGKTTITEKLLLICNVIQTAGTIKARKAEKHATSDWLKLEQQRGISVTTSVMQLTYEDYIINLLDTPGHADFGEDTYRTLTAVDSVLMIIDAAKGVEPRTKKLMEICRMRDIPIITFINKMDRNAQHILDLFDDIEKELSIHCVPCTLPIGMGQDFQGIYNLMENTITTYAKNKAQNKNTFTLNNLKQDEISKILGNQLYDFKEELDFIHSASEKLDHSKYLAGQQTPTFFGSALQNIGVNELLKYFCQLAPTPMQHKTNTRTVQANESKFSGFVFKIQANMDPKHHDRIAFMRICSGKYDKSTKLFHTRTKKLINNSNIHTFLAGKREHIDSAIAGDIIGIPNHGTIKIGDTFTTGEDLKFTGIPHFAPELFKKVRAADPLKNKTLIKGLQHLSEEGAVQIFKPLQKFSAIIVGAIGILQFDVVAHRLKHEYKVDCIYESASILTTRWLHAKNNALQNFKHRYQSNLALDAYDNLVYLAPSMVNLSMVQEKWSNIEFLRIKEIV